MADKMMPCFCAGCHEVFMIPSRRGRPPKFCRKCQKGDSPQVAPEDIGYDLADKMRAKRRVDNLEMMLRSRGTHISQHQ